MHYGKFVFARDPDVWTIKPKDEYKEFEENIGQRRALSAMDANKVNNIYRCSAPVSKLSSVLISKKKTTVTQWTTKRTEIPIPKTQASTTSEDQETTDADDDQQTPEPKTTIRTTNTPLKMTTSSRRSKKTPATPEPSTEDKQTSTPKSTGLIAGANGSRTFRWTGPDPQFYKPPQNQQEFYPWLTNGLVTFNGEQRMVSSGFDTGIYANGTHWRKNWYQWRYLEE
jgi:Astacin (Peptidase family M12A)